MAVPTKRIPPSQAYPASALLERIRIFPRKPAVGGKPASATKKTVMAAAANGRRLARPR
jgi:hypothetical protein